MAVELATGYVSLVSETSQLARGAGRAFDRIATDAQRRLARAFDASADDMVRAFSQASGRTFDTAATQMRQNFARGFGQAADDMHREFARASTRAFSGAAGEMQGQFRRGFDASADDMRRAFARASNRVGNDLEDSIRDAGRGAGQQGGDAAAGGIADSLSGKAGVIGQALGAVFAVAGVSAGGLLAKALQRGLEHETALDLAQARIGVDDATMHKIGTAAGRAYTGAFGESVEENIDTARRAVQSGLLDPNATAQETQQVIQQLSGIAQMMGEEIPAVSRAAGQAIKTGIAGSATEAFDLFAVAERNGLNVSEDFLDTITEYGTQFRKLGLSGPEAIGLINQAVKAGARDSDIAADAIKEFSIRVVDGSESTVEAFQTLGFEADDLTSKFAQGGSVARTAVGDLLAKIREIEDPVERNKVALALFGTQFEDLGDALNQFNLDTAVNSLGQVAGAAQNALNTVGGNAATSIEGAKRSIEVSADAIGAALAKAFGPELAKVADWVTKHQPEILGFMGKLADGAIATADAFLSFASISLNAFADLAEGVGPILEQTLDPMGKVAEVIGKLTGSEGLEDLGHTLQEMENTMRGAADGARDIADGIDNSARPSLDRMRASVAENIAETRHAAEVTRALGDTVTALPDGHDIIIKENTPEVQARLEALGYRVTHMEDGQFRVEANTAEAQQRLNDFIHANSGKTIPVEIMASLSAQSRALNAEVDRASRAQPGTMAAVPHYADGGIREASISNGSRAILWAEAGPEAYIPLSPSKRDKSVPIWMEVGRRLGLITAMAAGGIVPGKAFAQSLDPAKYQMGGFSTSAIDCSGLVSAVVNDALGRPPFSSRMSTMSEGQWLAALGAKPGLGGPGDISVGWYDNGGGANGHTAMTLGDGTNVESNGSEGVVVGGKVGADHSMFTQRMHLPAALLRGGDLGGPATGAPAGAGASTGGSGGAGATGGLGGGTAAGAAGGTFGGVEVPAGVTPVWIVGSNVAGASNLSSAPAGSSSSPSTTAAPSESFAPQASTQPAPMPDIGARALQAGSNFLNANLDQFLGDIGLRREGGAIQALAKVIFDAMARATSEAVAQATRNPGSLIRHAGRPF
ncbi:phage tail tape measure protein [Nocardia gipuzkoensis]|uniref:phage tail tape measure protein n=1 Tax=Nocardia gipuzkoensis TaxID=2749991 RepID=UPI001E4270E6|nr:phage tail tape measure protein [Nocardia gipuzkoensis]UGT65332.1 phage tail tape measure protein [Nocardia gipuzkoensis]